MDVKQLKARAVGGGNDPRSLDLARKVGESTVIYLNGEVLEVTVICIANNSVALRFETAEKNLILRKELVD